MCNRPLLILFSIIVVDLIGFGIVMPILPFYAGTYGASAGTLGLLLTVYAAMQFLFAPVWGRLSDRIGRRKVLAITLFAGSLSLVILGCATSLFWLFVGRACSGIFAANLSVASAYVTDVTTETDRAKGMGMIGAAFGVGFLLGPILGGLLAPHGYALPILVAAALTGLNALSVVWRLPEPAAHRSPETSPLADAFGNEDRGIRRLVFMNFLFTAGVALLETTMAFFLRDAFAYDAHHVAYLFAAMAAIMVIVQGGLIRPLTQRFGERRLLLAGSCLLAAALCALPLAHRLSWLLGALIVIAIGRGASQPALLSLVSRQAAPAHRGRVMGVFQSAASLARVAAPAFGGFVYDWSHPTVFVVAGGFVALVTVATARTRSAVPAHDWTAPPDCGQLGREGSEKIATY